MSHDLSRENACIRKIFFSDMWYLTRNGCYDILKFDATPKKRMLCEKCRIGKKGDGQTCQRPSCAKGQVRAERERRGAAGRLRLIQRPYI